MGKLVDALYPRASAPEEERQRAHALRQIESTSGAMRIAEEYESIFGRNALDDLIIREVPDLDHEPGALHRLMLKLPWADVLTTNWDTLLERAARTVVDQRYEVVMVPEDLPRTSRPRIVKLHGTLPSNRPFIFTEEDFRTYQDRFPVFVNLVRQTMAENLLCLIGFSGDDPNFLYWSGWVRDTLGKAAPRVYLCGLLDSSPSQRKLLADRNVMTVDLSPLFPVAQWPDPAERHSSALEWFYLALEAGRPPDRLSWPVVKPLPATQPSTPSLPPLPAIARLQVEDEPYWPDAKGEPSLSDTIALWQRNRALYPGWVVAPPKVRARLWKYTESWISPLMAAAPQQLPWRRLVWFDVLNWRLERCLVPLWPDLARLIADALDACAPFTMGFDAPVNQGSPDHAELRRIWSRLAYARMRYLREAMDGEALKTMEEMLTPIAANTPWLWDAIHHERCLTALERHDHSGAVSVLQNWRGHDDDAMWDIRRAALYAFLGYRRKAQESANCALGEIRRRLGSGGGDIGMSSREGCALLVLKVLDYDELSVEPADRLGRWEELGRILCDLQEGIDRQMEDLGRDSPQPRPSVSTRVGFDPGERAKTHHLASEGLLPRLTPAYTFLRLIEDGGVPVRCGHTSYAALGLVRAGVWLADDFPEHSVRAALRSGNDDGIKNALSRRRVATMPEWVVKSLFYGALGALTGIALRWKAGALAEEGTCRDTLDHQLQTASEIASRLLVRLDADAGCKLFDVGLRLWDALSASFRPFRMIRLRPLIHRALNALPAVDLAQRLPMLLGTPVDAERLQDDLADLLPNKVTWSGVDVAAVSERLRAVVAGLLDKTASSTGEPRIIALARLLWLQENELILAVDADRLASILWAQPENGALSPDFAGVSRAALLNAAGRYLETAIDSLRCYLLDSASALGSPANEVNGSNLSADAADWLAEIIWATKRREANDRIDWTSEEAERLWDAVIRWWEAEGRGSLDKVTHPITGHLSSYRLAALIDFIEVILVPRRPADSPRWPETLRIIEAIDAAGVPATSIRPVLLRVLPNQLSETASKLRSELAHSDETRFRSALRALLQWILSAGVEGYSEPPGDLLQQVGALVANRRVPALFAALGFLADLARKRPQALTPDVVEAACTGLDYLLTELDYRSRGEVGRGSVPVEEIPDYRAKAAALAAALSGAGHPCPALRKWIEAATDDPLPEVRAAASISTSGTQR